MLTAHIPCPDFAVVDNIESSGGDVVGDRIESKNRQ